MLSPLTPRSSIDHMRLREERAREIFQEFDTNSDGIIDMDELKAMLTALGLEPKDEDDFDTTMRKFLGEGFYGGLGNYLFGVDVASRMGLSDLIFRDRVPTTRQHRPVWPDSLASSAWMRPTPSPAAA